MRTILFIIRKEFLQIFRNKGMLPIIFVMPVIQLLILSNAADFEIKNLKVFWVDKDNSSVSRDLKSKFQGSNYFMLTGNSLSTMDAEISIEKNESDIYIEIPTDFERKLIAEGGADIQIIINAIDGTKAGLGSYYASTVIAGFNNDLRNKLGVLNRAVLNPDLIATEYSFWFNPALNYTSYMVPGILVLLVTMIGVFLSAMNIVREKEIGTAEQLNVTPIRKSHFIIGKLAPFWILGIFEFTLGLIIAKFIFNVPFVGSLPLVYAFAAVYMVMILGMGLFISTITNTQQQAMFIAWFFLVVFILMGGLFTPIESMPDWAQTMTLFNPIRYFIEVIRMVLLKGSGFMDVRFHFIVVTVYAIVINGLATWNYRKTA